jgi:ABC-type lipoprotein release transport system permease subunit
MNSINFYLLEYAYNYILRHKNKNIFIITVFTLLVALLCSLFFITASVEKEMQQRIALQPDIVVQNYRAGMPCAITEKTLERLLNIDGITSGRLRVRGDYYFSKEHTKFHIEGVEPFEECSDPFIQKLIDTNDINSSVMLVSNSVQKRMQKAYYTDYFNFILEDGTLKKLSLLKSFDFKKRLDLQNLILVNSDTLREIFGYNADEGSDIALKVANKNELNFLTAKIRLLLPNAKVISKNDLKLRYKSLFNYDNGIFLSLFIIAIFTFFIIIYDKANGLSSQEKREIGILKAIGWRVEDVLHAKFYEAAIISFFSFLMGYLLAFIFVFYFKAPLFGNIFMNESLLHIENFRLDITVDFSYTLLIFLLSVPLYIAATLIPSWRVATLDADEVMR